MSIEVYTDGSCDQFENGGYAAIIKISAEKEYQISGGSFNTSSTQMELTAVLSALNYLDAHHYGEEARITCDYLTISENLSNGMSLEDMKLTSLKDKALWEEIYNTIDGRTHFTFEWVKGHNGHIENERVDKLAQLARKRFVLSQKPQCFIYYNSVIKATIDDYYVNQTVGVMIKQQGSKQIKTCVDSIGVCLEDKNLIELRSFERALRYATDSISRVSHKKVIVFCNSKYIILTLKDIRRNRYVFNGDAYSLVWIKVLEMLEQYDIEVFKAGRSKLDYFEIALEDHVKNQEKVRDMLAA